MVVFGASANKPPLVMQSCQCVCIYIILTVLMLSMIGEYHVYLILSKPNCHPWSCTQLLAVSETPVSATIEHTPAEEAGRHMLHILSHFHITVHLLVTTVLTFSLRCDTVTC